MKIYDEGTLVVWFYQDDEKSTVTFAGQDLGGYPGSSEYEYWITVDRDEFRQALDVAAEDDLEGAVLTYAKDIITRGEMRWLQDNGIEYDFSSRVE